MHEKGHSNQNNNNVSFHLCFVSSNKFPNNKDEYENERHYDRNKAVHKRFKNEHRVFKNIEIHISKETIKWNNCVWRIVDYWNWSKEILEWFRKSHIETEDRSDSLKVVGEYFCENWKFALFCLSNVHANQK